MSTCSRLLIAEGGEGEREREKKKERKKEKKEEKRSEKNKRLMTIGTNVNRRKVNFMYRLAFTSYRALNRDKRNRRARARERERSEKAKIREGAKTRDERKNLLERLIIAR